MRSKYKVMWVAGKGGRCYKHGMKIMERVTAKTVDQIELDDELLKQAEQSEHDGVMRFWEAPDYAVVMGRSGKAEMEVQPELVAAERIPVLQRSSGGGTVVQGPGCLNYVLVLPKRMASELDDVVGSYRWISERVLAALAKLGVDAVFEPISDLALRFNRKKFSGNAQRRSRQYILHHGTILYDFDLSLISRYLAMPEKVPPYRQGRSHEQFVTNIEIEPGAFEQALIAVFS